MLQCISQCTFISDNHSSSSGPSTIKLDEDKEDISVKEFGGKLGRNLSGGKPTGLSRE